MRFIARDKPDAAEAILDPLLDTAGRPGKFPDMGVKGRVASTRELTVPHLPYIPIYRKRGDRVEILNLFHTSRQR